MPEEAIEDAVWESEDAIYESEEAIAEAEDSAEDIGEASSRRRRRSRFQPGRGVQGITVRNQDGKVRNLPFPTKLATVDETNRGLAKQEVARRALDERVDRLEARFKSAQKKDTSIGGVVTLLLGGGLTALGAIEAAKDPSGGGLGTWAGESTTQMAALVSVTQLVTSGAKFAMNGHYHRNGIGIAADVFSLAQIATFAYGNFHQPHAYTPVADRAALDAQIATANPGTLFVIQQTGDVYQLIVGTNNVRAAVKVN